MIWFLVACTDPLADDSNPGTVNDSEVDDTADTGEVADGCAPLDPPELATWLSPGDDLRAAIDNATAGETLMLNAGTYDVPGNLWIRTPGVTLQGVGADEVILDAGRQGGSVVVIAASDVTVAHVTLANAWYHGIHVRPDAAGPVENTLIYGVHVLDPGEQAIKINQEGADYVDQGVIACSRLTLTDEGRPAIRNNCYTGGIDAHKTRGWHIRDNHIEGFWCDSGLAEHGIHMWRQNADTLIERNEVVNCARGIGLGLSETSSGDDRDQNVSDCPDVAYIDDFRGTIVNNTVYADASGLFASAAGFDSGIAVWNACQATVIHNTVVSTSAPFSSIEYRFAGTTLELKNNLTSHAIKDRTVTRVVSEGNLTDAGPENFVGGGDLHLVEGSTALDAGVPVEVTRDIDGDLRGTPPDVGADERL